MRGWWPGWVAVAAQGMNEQTGYFVARDGSVAEVLTFKALCEAFRQPADIGDARRVADEAYQMFLARARGARRQEQEIEDARKRGRYLALEEEGRQLLLRAALIELAIAHHQELWDEPSSAEFSEDSVRGLRRRGFPFAPLLSLVNVEGLRPSPTDPFFVRIQGDTRESLDRRMAPLKLHMAEVVQALAAFKKGTASESGVSEQEDIPVSVTIFR